MRLGLSILPLLIPLLSLALAKYRTDFPPAITKAAASTATGGLHVSGEAPTTAPQAWFAHPSESHHGHGCEDQNENEYFSIDGGEDGTGRPRPGQNASGIETQTKLKESEECTYPPTLSCSAEADETDSCCASTAICA